MKVLHFMTYRIKILFMYNFYLSPKEKTSLEGRHNISRDGKLTISSGGSASMLNEGDTQELKSYLETNTYRTTQEIIGYVVAKYGVTYSVPGMNKWLHRNGFSYKKPKGYPHKASLEQQEQFIKDYSDLKANWPSEDGIMFMDSCHLGY